MNKQCSTCCFGDVCPYRTVCDHYTPTTEELSDEILLDNVEEERCDYYDAWQEYVDYDDTY